MESLCRVGLQKRKFLFQTSRGWHHCVCFSTIAHSLLSALMYMDCIYACGDAEACLSLFHFYFRLWLPYLVKEIYELHTH